MSQKDFEKEEGVTGSVPVAEPVENDRILAVSIIKEMKDSYLDYAMSVITSRALPDVRDGLKPVHRRILYAMHEAGLTASAKFRKSATVVGDTMGRYHPHGDSSVYDAMVQMAQDFSSRYPLVLGQGNFGSVDGDGAAAMRYTEAKMAKISAQLLRDIDKQTVDFRGNYDNSRKEPSVLPAAVPTLILNGTLGIAVGMATNIPPHNLSEIVDATVHLVENPAATSDDLLEFVKGPDFPTGGIVFNAEHIRSAYATGRGGVVCRGEAEIVELKNGTFQIIISSIPYRVVKQNLIEAMADLVRDKKIEGIKDIKDLSTKDIHVVIDLKQNVNPQKVLNYLYKHTQLEQNFNFNMVALVDGVPQTLSLKSILIEFISHRLVVIRRRTEYDLMRAREREHILLGLKKALDHIDRVITIIRESKDGASAKLNLIKEFAFSDLQAQAILDMRLQKLAGLERKAVELELKEKQDFIKECVELLGNEKKMRNIVSTELLEVRALYGDERRTHVVSGAAGSITIEDMVPDRESVLVFTKGGYVKRTDPSEYRTQKRGGLGVIDMETKEEDFVSILVSTNTHSDILFFTNKGRAYQIKMYELPEARRATKGKALVNFIQLHDDEKVTSILPVSKMAKSEVCSLVLVTKNGEVKKMSAESFKDVRRSGIIAMNIESGDELVSALLVKKSESVILVSREGQSIRFAEDEVREMGRTAGGVRGMRLDTGDSVVGVDVVHSPDAKLLVVSQNGMGKSTDIEEYKVQGRGGSGVKTSKVTPKTGVVVMAKVITSEDSELIVMSENGQVIRTELDTVPTLGRDTQGVSIMRLREGDKIASITCI